MKSPAGCPSGKPGASRASAIRYRDRKRALTGRQLYEYRCRHCGRWHITSQPPREKAA